MKIRVTVEIEVDTNDEEFAKAITSEMDYSFSFVNGNHKEFITDTVIKEIEIL